MAPRKVPEVASPKPLAPLWVPPLKKLPLDLCYDSDSDEYGGWLYSVASRYVVHFTSSQIQWSCRRACFTFWHLSQPTAADSSQPWHQLRPPLVWAAGSTGYCKAGPAAAGGSASGAGGAPQCRQVKLAQCMVRHPALNRHQCGWHNA